MNSKALDRVRTIKAVTMPAKKPTASKERTTGTQRHDNTLKQSFIMLSTKLEDVSKLLARIPPKGRVRDRDKILAKANKAINAADQHAWHLFEEGAEWLRKFNALETLCGPAGKVPNMERFAALFFAYIRFLETGLPALDVIRKRIAQCAEGRSTTGLPCAILDSNRDQLHQALHTVDTWLAQQVPVEKAA